MYQAGGGPAYVAWHAIGFRSGRFFNVQRWTEMPRGGHFAAMEEPGLLVDDIRSFFRPLRARHGVAGQAAVG
jgi:hypothetical protein